jgi:putative oxidoreductase
MTSGALLGIRIVLAAVFIAHGAQKLFGAFGGDGLAATADYFSSLGLHPGDLWAAVAGVGEVGGGGLMALGLLTPLAALDLVVVMVVAIVTVNGHNGFFVEAQGWEYNAALIAMAAAIGLAGPGRVSLDVALGLRRP